MKRLSSSDSSDGDDQVNNIHMYSAEFQAMLDGLDDEGGCIDHEYGHASPGKKRRLSIHQVKALEKNFEVENKLEPERKVKLALELGLQPRQVAVWFQNRRARWKTKQLERDYGVLKADYDALKLSCEKLQLDNEALLKEIRELKAKLSEEDGKESQLSAAKEDQSTASDDRENGPICEETAAAATEMEIVENFDDDNLLLCGFKVGSCDSDSSHNYVQVQKDYYFVKIEEEEFLGHVEEESCTNLNMFSDDEAPSLPWICSDQWN